MFDRVRRGSSAVLVIRGEAGVGKTTLVNHALARTSGTEVTFVSGAESEAELPFAAVHQLCAPHLDGLHRLPAPQRTALATALGLGEGTVPNRFLVGLAVLTLLSDVASKQSLVCVVDDAHWLDDASVQTLAIVGRRLRADPVALVFCVREGERNHHLSGLEQLPELILTGLDEQDSRTLLATTMPGPMDERVRERILAEARGNPLALWQLPRASDPGVFNGSIGLVGQQGQVTRRIERSFASQLSALPTDTRLLLLIAAAEPVGDAALLWRAAEYVGLTESAAAAAEASELISIGRWVRFRHPLVRSAVYRSASWVDRRRAHEALAASIDPAIDGEQRAWHRAQAATGPDETIAADLERMAGRALARGGVAGASTFLANAADLTPDPVERARRALAAARAKLDAGAPDAALQLVAHAQAAAPPEPLRQAQIEVVRSQIASATNRGRDAPALLLSAAEHLRELDPLLARETYLEALMASVFAGRLAWAQESTPQGVARAALLAPQAPFPPRTVDLLLEGLVLRFTKSYAAGAPTLMRAVRKFRSDDESGTASPRWYGLVCRIALDVWDQQSRDALSVRQVKILREQGVLTHLPVALSHRACLCLHAGRFDEAAALLEESDAISQVTGAPLPLYIEPLLAAYRGQQDLTHHLVRMSMESAARRGEGRLIQFAQYATAVLHNSVGQYREALAATDKAVEHDDLGMYGYSLHERVEAAVRSGEITIASETMRELVDRATAAGTELAFGVAMRSRALLAEGSEADELYRAAMAHLERSGVCVLYARTQLLYGEWLRRERRRTDAINQLRQAYSTFRLMCADKFAERARRELGAAGDVVEAPAASSTKLTAQETSIAKLAAEGQSNSDIAAQLFLSKRTVEWHLSRIYGKLGITSRRQLRSSAICTGDYPEGFDETR